MKNENEKLYTALEVEEIVAKAVAEAEAPLLLRIAQLEAIINKDSSNSSKPPGSNGFKQIPNSREKSGKPQGGQKGSKGHRLQLPDNIDELVGLGHVERRVKDHTDGSDDYVSKYTLDIEMKTIITEHRFVKGSVPEEFYNEVTYGEQIKAIVVLLLNEGMISHNRLSEIVSELSHNIVTPSTGTISKIQSDFADKLSKSDELKHIKQNLLDEKVMCVDDTPVKVQEKPIYSAENDEFEGYERGKNKSLRATVRTHSNDNSTLYTVNPKKDDKGIKRDGILPNFKNTLVSDHESKFLNYGGRNASCGAHLSRELKGFANLYNCPWGEKMRKFIQRMNTHKHNDDENEISQCDTEILKSFEVEYDDLVSQGFEMLKKMHDIDLGYKKIKAMIHRLECSKDMYILFMRDYDVPFTNNLAERDLRPEKTKEKISGLFQSWKGVEDHCKIRSFISTLKKRGHGLFDSIKKIILEEPVLSV